MSETQNGLNTLVREKLAKKIERSQPKAKDAVAKLIEEGKISKDYVAPLGVKLRSRNEPAVITFRNDVVAPEANAPLSSRVLMNLAILTTNRDFMLHEHAVGQIGEKLGIPTRYIKDLATGREPWQKNLAAQIMNEHSLNANRERVLIRSVGSEVRGVLSDSYKRLNSEQVVTSFLQEVEANGAVLCDGFMDSTRMWFETLYPEAIDIPTAKNGIVTIAFGARFSTSDYGDGALEMRAFMMQGACLNGMVRESMLRSVHLGTRLPENLSLSERTYALDTRTQASAVRDITKNMFNKDSLYKRVYEIQNASLIEVDMKRELSNLTKGKMLKEEAQEIEKILMRNNPDDGVSGESTLWKLTQGITAHARTVNERRQRELQEIAGDLMDRTYKLKIA